MKIVGVMPEDIPDLSAILVQCLLFKLGGEYTFTSDELTEIKNDYMGIRLIWDELNKSLTIRLKPWPEDPHELIIAKLS